MIVTGPEGHYCQNGERLVTTITEVRSFFDRNVFQHLSTVRRIIEKCVTKGKCGIDFRDLDP